MAEYIINWSDEGVPGKDPIRLAERTKDTSSTSLTLTGRGTASYGEIQQENFIRLLENFASSAAPSNSTIGQLWYDTLSGSLKIKFGENSSDWKNVNLLPSQTGNSNKYLRTDGSSLSWNAITANDLLPGQAGNTGKVLTTNGSSLSWSNVLPGQSGNTGKVLTTDGNAISWASALPGQAGNTGKVLTTDGNSASWKLVPDLLPSQSGNTGKVLTTDGNAISWASSLPNQSGNANKFLSTNGTAAFWDDGGSIVISTSAPTSPTVGKVWYDNGTRGRAFIWTGSSWVDMSPGAAGGGSGNLLIQSTVVTASRYTQISAGEVLPGKTINGVFNNQENYFDMFPPTGYTMTDLKAAIPSINRIRYAGIVDSNDVTRCYFEQLTDRLRVWVGNTEMWEAASANVLTVWRR